MQMTEKIPKIKFPCPVLRVRIQIRKGEWEILKVIKIRSMTLNQPAELPATRKGYGISGFWVEAVDEKNRPLYRTVEANPFEKSVEQFDSDGTPYRVDVAEDEFLLEVLIPDLSKIRFLVFYSDITEDGKRMPKAYVLHKLPLSREASKGGSHGRK